MSKSRSKKIAESRTVALYLCRRITDHPLKVIGERFNRRHTTVVNAVHRIEKSLHQNSSLGRKAEFLIDKLENQL